MIGFKFKVLEFFCDKDKRLNLKKHLFLQNLVLNWENKKQYIQV